MSIYLCLHAAAREGQIYPAWGQVEDGCLIPPSPERADSTHMRQDLKTISYAYTLRQGWCGFPHGEVNQQQTV